MNSSVDSDAIGRRLRRVLISDLDLQDARLFAETALATGNSGEPPEEVAVRRALSLALVVSYSRPFGTNQAEGGEEETVKLGNLLKQGFSKDELAVHRRVLELRNQELAHSDVAAHGISLSRREGTTVPIGRVTGRPLPQRDIEHLLSMIEKARARLAEERRSLDKQLPEGFVFSTG